jgi:hypothetical protein
LNYGSRDHPQVTFDRKCRESKPVCADKPDTPTQCLVSASDEDGPNCAGGLTRVFADIYLQMPVDGEECIPCGSGLGFATSGMLVLILAAHWEFSVLREGGGGLWAMGNAATDYSAWGFSVLEISVRSALRDVVVELRVHLVCARSRIA